MSIWLIFQSTLRNINYDLYVSKLDLINNEKWDKSDHLFDFISIYNKILRIQSLKVLTFAYLSLRKVDLILILGNILLHLGKNKKSMKWVLIKSHFQPFIYSS